MSSAKIKTLEELAQILDAHRAARKKIVQCHGVFDLIHVGHIRHLQQAKAMGDILIVTITPDEFVNKGPHRPAFPQNLRAEVLASLDVVDYVAINRWPRAVEVIQLLKPNCYVKGSDYKIAEKDVTGGIALEEDAVRAVGGKICFTEDITFSSTTLINTYLPAFSREVTDYLEEFRQRHSVSEIQGYIESLRSLKVLVIGETLIDEYQYCDVMGKSGKEPILAARYVEMEKFAGGALALANNVAAFCGEVGLLSALGSADSQVDFVRSHLAPNIQSHFVYLENAPTIIKRRFVNRYPFQKLFEVYVMNDDENTAAETTSVCEQLQEMLPKYDLVIAMDYGHGLLMTPVIDLLTKQARFLAVNTQINAGNHGFNTISKYPRADYVSISEYEARLDARSQHLELEEIISDIARRLSAQQTTITRGQSGSICFGTTDGFFNTPAFSVMVVDRIGAGDAVLAVTSLCAARGVPTDVLGFIGSVVGAEAVGMVGHRKSIERVGLLKHIESLLK